jgi:predicted amidohydrolase
LSVRVAAAAYPIERLASLEEWRRKIAAWIEGAASGGAELALFPEYAGLELASALGEENAADLARSIAGVSALVEEVDAHHAELAALAGIHILAGSLPVALPDGRVVNRARLFSPRGAVGAQEKIVMTRFERESFGISGGDTLRVFHTALGPIGIAICYDAEFPLIARQLCAAGAEILLVPSATDTTAGGHRVRTGARARALENQCYAVVSCTTGRAEWSPALDSNCGRPAVYGPPQVGFPEDGTVAEGALDTPGWLFADLDLGRVRAARADGEVLLFRHWGDSEIPLAIERRTV